MDSHLDSSIGSQLNAQQSKSLNLVSLTRGAEAGTAPTQPSETESGQQLVLKPLDYGSDSIGTMSAAQATGDIQTGLTDLFKGYSDVSIGGADLALGDAKDGNPLISNGENEIRTGANDLVQGLTGLIDSQPGSHGSSSTSTSDSTTPKSTATSTSDSATPKSTASSTSDSTTPKPTASSTSDSTTPKPTASSTSDSTTPKPTASSTSDSTTPKSTATSTSDSATPKSTASSTSDSTTPKPTASSTSDSTTPKSTASSTSDSTTPKSTASSTSDSTTPKSTASSTSDSTTPKSTASSTSDSTTPKSTASSTSDSTTPKSTTSVATTGDTTPSAGKGTLKANAGLAVVSTENAAVAKADPLGQAPSESAIQSFVNKAGDLNVQVKPGDLYVNKDGKDGAYKTIQSAVDAAKAGQTIVIADGTYDEDVKLKQSVTLLGQAGATIDGSGKSSCIDATNVSNVTIKGLTLEKANNALQAGELQITGGSNWLVENDVMKDSAAAGIASKGTDNLSVIGNKMDDNGQEGYVLGKSDSLLFADNEVSGNNTRGINSGWEAGGGKFVKTQGAVIENNIVTDNNGPGLWSDVNCNDSLIKNNFVSDNNGAGIFYEISTNGTIENNTVTNNSQSYHPWGWGAGIEISASSGTKVENNLLVNNGNGIAFIQQNRGSSTDVHGDDATGNTVIGGAAPLGWYSDYEKTIWSSSNTAENNNIYGDKVAWSKGDESVAALKGTPVAKETVLSKGAAQTIVNDDGIDDTV